MAAALEAPIGWLVRSSATIGALKFKGKWSVVSLQWRGWSDWCWGRVRSWQVRTRHCWPPGPGLVHTSSSTRTGTRTRIYIRPDQDLDTSSAASEITPGTISLMVSFYFPTDFSPSRLSGDFTVLRPLAASWAREREI